MVKLDAKAAVRDSEEEEEGEENIMHEHGRGY